MLFNIPQFFLTQVNDKSVDKTVPHVTNTELPTLKFFRHTREKYLVILDKCDMGTKLVVLCHASDRVQRMQTIRKKGDSWKLVIFAANGRMLECTVARQR